ncbi:F-box protein FBW2 [Camellia lanceoleosa]|uniref:F-box protein FBW2 n=1 Tax=Camellia lanceoleosa TaxID=1840588 RepID=A0ACC0HT43_9ERIC|nr:F-box protein FBW2 [Camellia lanceoleosa]
MHPIDMDGKLSQEDEAHAVAVTMPKLKHLEMAYLLIDTQSVLEIISSCLELEFLDLRGCWDVKLDKKYLEEKFPKLRVLGPQVVDHYERNSWEVCSDYTDSFYDSDSFSFDGMWDDEESLELRFARITRTLSTTVTVSVLMECGTMKKVWNLGFMMDLMRILFMVGLHLLESFSSLVFCFCFLWPF